MKKKLLLLFALALAATATALADVEINEANFPDPVFREWVVRLDSTYNNNGMIDQEEIDNVKYATFNTSNVYSFKGIECFTELVELQAHGNHLTELDLSHNTKIQRLYLNSNNLTKLDVSPLTELRWLYVAYNPLETLIMGNNRKMEIMVVAFTNLEDLDLSSCIGMTHLVAPGNKFKQIDLSKNYSLNELDLSSNQIKELDISNSPYLMRVLLHNNQMEKLKFTPGMTGIMMTLFNNQFKDEALDEIYKSMVFMTENLGGLAAWVYNDNDDYIEGNEFNYTYTTALGQGLEMGFGCTLFPYSGNPEDVTLDNMFEVLPTQMDQLYDGCPSVVLDENGYATFSCLAPMNLDNVYGPKIYKVEMAEGNRAQLSEATGQVDAETGIVLIGQPGEEVYIPSAVFDWSSGWVCSPLENNLLAGNLTKRTFTAGEAYVLKDGKFVLTQEGEELPCHTAYLPADAVINGANTLWLAGDGLTGVEDIVVPTGNDDAPIYDVMGRRVINPKAGGIYIQNGRKFIAK